MKKLTSFLILLFCIFEIYAQVPQAISYQAVARTQTGELMVSQIITLRFSIHDSTATGTIIYQETQTPTTNLLGLFSVNIGQGVVTVGNFSAIKWEVNSKFIEVEINTPGGYSSLGTQQMLSVPYALSAGNTNWTKAGNNISNNNSGNVGVGTSTPVSSALLEVRSTTQGFLPPRMSYSQRNAIAGPVVGLIVYCTDCGINAGELQIYNGFSWRKMSGEIASEPMVIGQNYQGGILAYILQPGDPGYDPALAHGIIAAPSNLANTSWGCTGTSASAVFTAIGTGDDNTGNIVFFCSTTNIAARLCYDLNIGGYSDWWLPNKDELYKLFLNQVAIGAGIGTYWSSSESTSSPANNAQTVNFLTGVQGNTAKGVTNFVRPIRMF